MKTKQQMIENLNRFDAPKTLGFERYSDDGQGNEYWVRRQGATTIRLNRHEDDESGVTWDDDVAGWENPS